MVRYIYIYTCGKYKLHVFLTVGGVLVIRPDSGDPPQVVVKVLDILGKHITCVLDVIYTCTCVCEENYLFTKYTYV